MKSFWLLIILGMMGFIESQGQSQTVVLQPGSEGKCAYICTCKPSINNPSGDATHLWQGYINESGFHQCYERFLIQWDITSIPPNATIADATMELYCDYYTGTQKGKMIYQRINGDWDKKKVCIDIQPEASEADKIQTNWPSSKKWHAINITKFVQGWHKGDFKNFGILAMCTDTGNSTSSPAFYSFSWSNAKFRPKLTITYTEPLSQVPDWKKQTP